MGTIKGALEGWLAVPRGLPWLYSGALKRVTTQVAVLRAMQQLSEVYSVMTIASLSELVPFFGFSQVEQIIVEAVKQGYLQVRYPASLAVFSGKLLLLHMLVIICCLCSVCEAKGALFSTL